MAVPSKNAHSIWKILFVFGVDEYPERLEGKIKSVYSFMLKYSKTTVQCDEVIKQILCLFVFYLINHFLFYLLILIQTKQNSYYALTKINVYIQKHYCWYQKICVFFSFLFINTPPGINDKYLILLWV